MDPIGRVVMALLAAFMLWTLLRGTRTGVLYSKGWSIDINESPVLYALDYGARLLLVVACVGLAAGYTVADEKRFALMLLTAAR